MKKNLYISLLCGVMCMCGGPRQEDLGPAQEGPSLKVSIILDIVNKQRTELAQRFMLPERGQVKAVGELFVGLMKQGAGDLERKLKELTQEVNARKGLGLPLAPLATSELPTSKSRSTSADIDRFYNDSNAQFAKMVANLPLQDIASIMTEMSNRKAYDLAELAQKCLVNKANLDQDPDSVSKVIALLHTKAPHLAKLVAPKLQVGEGKTILPNGEIVSNEKCLDLLVAEYGKLSQELDSCNHRKPTKTPRAQSGQYSMVRPELEDWGVKAWLRRLSDTDFNRAIWLLHEVGADKLLEVIVPKQYLQEMFPGVMTDLWQAFMKLVETHYKIGDTAFEQLLNMQGNSEEDIEIKNGLRVVGDGIKRACEGFSCMKEKIEELKACEPEFSNYLKAVQMTESFNEDTKKINALANKAGLTLQGEEVGE